MNATARALQGKTAAISRFDRASVNLLRSRSGAAVDDTAATLAAPIEARAHFRASVAALRAADDMTRALLDIKV